MYIKEGSAWSKYKIVSDALYQTKSFKVNGFCNVMIYR